MIPARLHCLLPDTYCIPFDSLILGRFVDGQLAICWFCQPGLSPPPYLASDQCRGISLTGTPWFRWHPETTGRTLRYRRFRVPVNWTPAVTPLWKIMCILTVVATCERARSPSDCEIAGGRTRPSIMYFPAHFSAFEGT